MKDITLPKPSIGPSTTVITPQQAQKFVYFSAQTQGSVGRPVKIDPQLLPHFLCLVDPSSHQGQAVIRHIESLRAKAGTGDSFQNANRAFDFMDHIGNVRVHYKMMQAEVGEPVGVYITDIRPGYRGDSAESGLYSARGMGANISITKSKDTLVSSSKASINGAAGDLTDAAEKVLKASKETSTALFYNPAQTINDMGCWFKPSKQGLHARVAAERLAAVLHTTETKGSGTVSWQVHGEGAQLLAKALETVPSNLTRHRFQFLNPVGDMQALLGNIKRKKAELAESVVNYDLSSGAMISFLAQRGALANTIRSLSPQGHPYSQPREKLVNKLLGDTTKTAGAFQSAKNSATNHSVTFLGVLKQTKEIYGAPKK